MLANHRTYIPLAVTDHLGPLIKECFKVSATAQEFKYAKIKTFCILNKAAAPHFKTMVMNIQKGTVRVF